MYHYQCKYIGATLESTSALSADDNDHDDHEDHDNGGGDVDVDDEDEDEEDDVDDDDDDDDDHDDGVDELCGKGKGTGRSETPNVPNPHSPEASNPHL